MWFLYHFSQKNSNLSLIKIIVWWPNASHKNTRFSLSSRGWRREQSAPVQGGVLVGRHPARTGSPTAGPAGQTLHEQQQVQPWVRRLMPLRLGNRQWCADKKIINPTTLPSQRSQWARCSCGMAVRQLWWWKCDETWLIQVIKTIFCSNFMS